LGHASSPMAEPFLEFGLCGLDRSLPRELFPELFERAESGCAFVAAFQLAYQGFPWEPAPAYAPGAALESRRYGGLVYADWDEISDMIKSMPEGTPVSFHLNETPACPYVSGLLRGNPDMLKLVAELVRNFNARHIQINLISAPEAATLFMAVEGGRLEDNKAAVHSATMVRQLCASHPDTTFLVPVTKMRLQTGLEVDTSAFMELLLAEDAPTNLSAFYDSSAGQGIEPDAAPQVPAVYPKGRNQPVGFTGGINAENAAVWLDRYAQRAREHGCRLISDAQSGFREGRKRGNRIDVDALRDLVVRVRAWAAAQTTDMAQVAGTAAG